jgi:DNA-binding NtrC family response regulator
MLRATQKSILVLDDDADVGNLFKLGLQMKLGSNVFVFTKPILALEHFKINSDKYGLVISDVRMPVMNGYEFATKVKQINPDVKICLISAFDVKDLKVNLVNSLNIDEFLQKPLSVQRLAEIVGNILNIYNN